MQFLQDLDWARWSGPALTGARIALIIVLASLAISLLQRLVSTARIRIEKRNGDAEGNSRAATVGRVLRYLIAGVIGTVAFMLVLGELGVSLAPILGAAGVVGLAVGFGAQSLVKDYFTGFFLLFEDQLRTGDVVNVAGIGGVVEDITLRHIRLRDYDGNVHFVPNSLVTTVTNMSRDFGNAVMEVPVPYRENLDEVMAVLHAVAADLRADPAFGPLIRADLEMAGVDRLDNGAAIVRCRLRVAPSQQWGVRREFLRRAKAAFDVHGIELSVPHLRLLAGVDKEGQAPALPVALARAPRAAASR